MAVSKAQQKAVHKYVKSNYDRMELTVPKGRKDAVKSHAAARGESVNGFIGRAIDETMERDNSTATAGTPVQAAGAAQGCGVVSLPSEVFELAQKAAENTGEAVPDFIRRAVSTQAQRDETSLRLGINPVSS